MPIRIDPAQADAIAAEALMRVKQRQKMQVVPQEERDDIVLWAERHFYLADTGAPIVLLPHQKAILRRAFTKDPLTGRFPYTTVIYSTPKKSGKTTISGLVLRWIAETQTQFGEIYCIGNDAEQARERGFLACKESIMLTPGFRRDGMGGELPYRWRVTERYMYHVPSGSKVKAIPVDAPGEAGANPDLTVWTELWGLETASGRAFWEEMTTVPTRPNSMRLVETYAGYDGESEILKGLYDLGKDGRHLTSADLFLSTGESGGTCASLGAGDFQGEEVQFFAEAQFPHDHIPIWENPAARMLMYWDEGEIGRRMPWQHGTIAEEYYAQEELTLPPAAFQRLHLNRWVGAESEFVPIESWDACFDPDLRPLLPGDKTPIVLGVDAASTGDCFGVLAVTRHPTLHEEIAVRFSRKWTPPKGGRIDYSEPDNYIRLLCQGGCAEGHPISRLVDDCPACAATDLNHPTIPPYNVVQVCYDIYQLEDMMQAYTREGMVWCQAFAQTQNRLIADRGLHDKILKREVHHSNDTELREHITNANAKHQKDQDSSMRIVKKSSNRKVDLVVCLSMATDRCLELVL